MQLKRLLQYMYGLSQSEVSAPTLRHPELRKELIEILQVLADAEYQRLAWIEQTFAPKFESEFIGCAVQYIYFGLIVDFIYDGTGLVQNPASAIGVFLKNRDEAQTIASLILALEAVLGTVGLDATDETYISSPRWVDVITLANRALQTMHGN